MRAILLLPLLLTACATPPPGSEAVNIHAVHRYAFLISAYGSRLSPPLNFPLLGITTNGSKIFMDSEHLADFRTMDAWFSNDVARSKSN